MTKHEIQITGQGFDDMFADWATIPGEDRDDLSHWDMDAIRAEYNAELDNLAPEGVSWGWSEAGPYIYAGVELDADEVRDAFTAATASAEEGGINLESIAMRHQIITIIEDNAGQYTLSNGTVGWQADWYAGDPEQAVTGARDWQSGEWEPSESDGWHLVDLADLDPYADHDAAKVWTIDDLDERTTRESGMVTYRVRRVEQGESGYQSEDWGSLVIEDGETGEWIADLDDLGGGSHEDVEAAAAQALGASSHAAAVDEAAWATPTGGNISGDPSHPNLGVTSGEWLVRISTREPKGWGWYR